MNALKKTKEIINNIYDSSKMIKEKEINIFLILQLFFTLSLGSVLIIFVSFNDPGLIYNKGGKGIRDHFAYHSPHLEKLGI